MRAIIILNLFFLVLDVQVSFARVHDFQSTRLKSTAGAGIASVLLDEATFLNPAPLAFFVSSSVYYQKTKTNMTYDPDPWAPTRNPPKPDASAFVLSDTAGRLKGSISYQTQQEDYDKRKRYAAAIASPIGQKSALGYTYRYSEDDDSVDGYNYVKDKYSQSSIGVIHLVSESLIMGFVVDDFMKKISTDVKATLGLQYNYKDFILLIGDLGGDYTQSISETKFYRAAMQFRVLSDFFVRFGTGRDEKKDEKNTGIGVSWLQPKLCIELSIQDRVKMKNSFLGQYNDKMRESSFSISYRW